MVEMLVSSVVLMLLTQQPAPAAALSTPPEKLRWLCYAYAANTQNPWALAHGITAFGAAYKASDGRNAAQAIVTDNLQAGELEKSKERVFTFERYKKDGTPVEPHANLISKTLTLAKLPGSTKFKLGDGSTVTLDQLVRSVELSFHHVPQNEEYWADVSWTLDLFAQRYKPGKNARFVNMSGQTIDLNQVFEDARTYWEKATTDLREGLSKAAPYVAKRKQGLYAHSCGGLHFVQAMQSWGRYPEIRKKWKKTFDEQINVLFYRLGSERTQYETVLQQHEEMKLQVLVQMLKFYGHFLETTARLREESNWKPTAAQKNTISTARALLDDATRQLDALGVFTPQRMAQLQSTQKQIYLDLIGDSCHAIHGFDSWHNAKAW